MSPKVQNIRLLADTFLSVAMVHCYYESMLKTVFILGMIYTISIFLHVLRNCK